MASPTRCRNKWRIRWTDETGRRRSAVYPSRREAAYQLNRREAEVEEVRRGLRRPTVDGRGFDELCDNWLTNRTACKRSPKDDQSIIRCHLRPTFGDLRLRDISLAVIDSYKTARAHLADKTVANHLTLLVSMLNPAVDLGWLHKAPKVHKPRVRLFSSDFWLDLEG